MKTVAAVSLESCSEASFRKFFRYDIIFPHGDTPVAGLISREDGADKDAWKSGSRVTMRGSPQSRYTFFGMLLL